MSLRKVPIMVLGVANVLALAVLLMFPRTVETSAGSISPEILLDAVKKATQIG